MTRQYIGARYVPRFRGLYDVTTQYEGLDVVDNGSGTSYIARKIVPPNTPLTNTEYWFVYGASSGAILDLQTRMDSAESDIDDLEILVEQINEKTKVLNDGIIVLGDSYGVDASAGGKSWSSYVQDVYPNIHKSMIGGTGFGSDVYITDNFLTMLQDIEADLTNTDDITTILILGGANDGNLLANGTLTENTLRSRIDSFADYAKAHFPYAKIKLGFIGGYRVNSRINYYNRCAKIYRSQISVHTNGCYYASGEPIMHNNAFINKSDLVHPTEDASKILSQFALSVLNDGDFCFLYDQDVTYEKLPDILAISNLTSFKAHYNGNMSEITFTGSANANTYISVSLSENISFNLGAVKDIMTLDGVPVGGTTPSMVFTNVIVGATGSQPIAGVGFIMGIQNNTLFVKNASGDDLTIKNILIPMTTFRILLDLN